MNATLMNRKMSVKLVLLLIADTVFFNFTNPQKVPSILLVVGFVLIVATVYCIVEAILEVLGKYFKIAARAHKLVVILMTVLWAVLVGLQSLGQLTLGDILVLIPVIAVLTFYLSYLKQS